MAHTLTTSSYELSDVVVRNINLDDTASSSDAGDVLIRSTGISLIPSNRIILPSNRIILPSNRDESVSSIRSHRADTVQITVKKLRDAPPTTTTTTAAAQPSASDYQTTKMEQLRQPKPPQKPQVPPLRANLPAAPVSHSEGAKVHKDKGTTKPGSRPRKENKVPTECDAGKDGKGIPARKTSGQPTASSSDQGRDLLISRYAAGGKGAVLAALKQRSQSAPLRREVKVQLLDPGPGSVQAGQAEPPQGPFGPSGTSETLTEPRPVPPLSRGEPGDAANTAAVVTAAAIAATFPLIKAQSEMEVRVSQVSESLRGLLEAERERQSGSRAQEGAGRGPSGDRTSERVAQLEQQLSALTEQRIQQLQLIQNQQIQLQSHLLGSALRVVTGSAPVTSAPVVNSDLSGDPVESNSQPSQQPDILRITHLDTVDVSTAGTNTDPSLKRDGGRSKSPLETPAPRRTVPKPSSGSSRWATRSQPARPAPTSSSSTSSKPRRTPRSQQGNGRLLEAILSNRRNPATGATAAETEEVAIATPSDDRHPEQIRGIQHPHEAPSVSTATQPPTGSHSQASANPSEAAVRRANDMLREMGRLKTEMQTLLTTQEPFPALEPMEPAKTRPVKPNPSSIFSPGPKASSAVSPGERAPPTTTTTTATTTTTFSSHLPGPPPPAPSSVSLREQTVNATSPVSAAPQPLAQPLPVLLQRRPAVPSMFEEAGRVLRRVQRQRKVLEENLEAMLRAKDGEILHCQLEALSNNRDSTEEVRVKKTVDAWISTLSKDIQVEVAKGDFAASQKSTKDKDASTKDVTKSQDAPRVLREKVSGGTDTARFKGRPLNTLRGPGSKMVARGSRGTMDKTEGQTDKLSKPTGQRRPGQVQPQSESLRADPGSAETEGGRGGGGRGEAYLMRLYGKALYEGHRRTLKKGPYLRFNSPASPRTKAPRPRLVESVRGVKMKSSKTQTSLASLPPAPPLSPPLFPSPGQPPHYIFSPSHVTPGDPSDPPTAPVEGFLIPMAIPLGQPRVDGLPPQPSRVLFSERPIIVTTSLPPSQPRPVPGPSTQGPRRPNVAVLEVYSDHKRQPQLQVQVQPSVNIEPPSPPSPDTGTDKQTVEIVEGKTEVEEEEENVFLGTDFLAVADIVQESQEESVLADVEIELDGQPSPPATMYHGPAFPPQPSAPLPAQEQASVLSLIQHRETLENRLVDWVEQQLMARMISEMYRPPPSDPAHNHSTTQSEPEERSAASDIVEGAGGAGIQLFVDASVPVDSDLIRQYVNEALAETVALMLGQREGQGLERRTQPAQEPPPPPPPSPPPLEERLVVPTPVPTPEASPSPELPSREPSPLGTPQPSEQGSPVQTGPPQHSTPAELDPEPLAMPTATPVPSPPPPDQRHLPWGDAELPLAEEQPHSQQTQSPPTRPVVMSVAAEEPVLSPPPPAPSIPSPQPRRSPTPPPAPAPGPESPASPPSSVTDDSSSTSSSSSSSTSSSSTVTAGTDTDVKQISDGELLLSFNQMAAMAAIEEEGVSHYVSSFSSSLHEVQDMDYDPPSEGQVRRPRPLSHHDPVLTLLARMDQGVISYNEPRPQPEGSGEEEEEMSVGEVKDDQRHTLTGHSQTELRDRTTKPHRTTSTSAAGPKATGTHSRAAQDHRSTEARQGQVSPGQLTQSADVTEVSFRVTNQGPVTMGDLEVEPIGTAAVTSDLQTDQSLSPPPLEETHTAEKVAVPEAVRPAPIMVLDRGEDRDTPAGQEEEEEVKEATRGGPRKMAVRLPSVGLERRDEKRGGEEEEEMEEEGSGSLAGVPDTDSSGNDVF